MAKQFDERVTEYLLPVRVMQSQGQAENTPSLLREKPLQIFTDEPDCLLLKNTGGEQAGVLLDFGRELAGGVRILSEVCAESGHETLDGAPRIRLVFGESAAEAMSTIGEKNATNNHRLRDVETRLCSYSDMTFAQTGFRFVRLLLLDDDASVRIQAVWAASTYRDLPYRGTFSCSDPVLDEIYRVCAYTCHLNMQSMLWDGVKRDRLVWIGDMHPEMLTIRTVFGDDPCIEQGLDYSTSVSPLPDYPNHMVTYAMWWLLILRDWHRYTGRDELVTGRAAYIRALLRQLCARVNEDGADNLGEDVNGYFLDWPTSENPARIAGVRALFALALRAGTELCVLLEDKDTAALCESRAAALGRTLPENYDAKPTAALMRLAGQLDDEETAALLLDGGVKGMSTFMSYYILTALAACGRTGQAIDLLRRYYGGMLAAGATTFWEDFDLDWLRDGARIDELPEPGGYDLHGDNGEYCYVGYRHSLCHGWSSAPSAFLAEQVLGVQILSPGCKKVRIRPALGDLEWAKGTYPTPLGDITVSHVRRSDGHIETTYAVPDGIEVEE